MNYISRGCGNLLYFCIQRKWCKVCFHKWMDDFGAVGIDRVIEAGIVNAYFEVFELNIKLSVLEKLNL